MTAELPVISRYFDLYRYLLVLSEEQIIKLRKIATGALSLSSFTSDELRALESRRALLNTENSDSLEKFAFVDRQGKLMHSLIDGIPGDPAK